MKRSRTLALLLLLAPATVQARTAEEELNLGVAHLNRGDEEQARGAFRRAVKIEPTVTLVPGRASPRAATLLREVRGGMKGTLAVLVRRGSGQVYVDGRRVGRTPFKGEVRVGRHTVEVRDGARRQAKALVVYHRINTELFLRNWGPAVTTPGHALAGLVAGAELLLAAGDPVHRLLSLAISLVPVKELAR